LKIIYQGFLIGEEQITLNALRRFIDLKKSFSLERYTLVLKITDTWGFPPAVDINPTIISEDMVVATTIRGDTNQEGKYVFNNLLPASYRLRMSYKTFRLEDNFTLEKAMTLDVKFPAEFTLNFSIFNSYANRLSSGDISFQRNGKTASTSIQQNGTASAMVPPGDYMILVHADNKLIAQQQIQVRGEKTMDIVTTQGSFLHTLIVYLGLLLVICTFVFCLWKKKVAIGLKFFTIGLFLIALVSPWWTLSGEENTISTTTNTFVVPPQIITLTTSPDSIGGEISAVPEEVTMVLGVLSLLVAVTCFILFLSFLTMKRLRKTTMILSFFSIVILFLSVVIFFYVFSQLTQVGVGSFMGNGNLDVTIPGKAEQTTISCSWGPGIGFYLLIPSLILLILTLFIKRIEKKFIRKK
jgi:hypothetical protein